MRRRQVLVLLLFAILGLAPSALSAQASGQDESERGESGFTLGQNYPNPFNPETRIPFVLKEELFASGQPVVVSVRVFNMLQQFVAAPVALDHPDGEKALIDVPYTQPGEYEAFWDGHDQTGREVASGVYFVQMTVNGEVQIKRIVVAK